MKNKILKELLPIAVVLSCALLFACYPETFNNKEIKYNDLSYLGNSSDSSETPVHEVSSASAFLFLALSMLVLAGAAYIFVETMKYDKMTQINDECHYELLMA